ncbi:hypothetical protein [Streptomyces coeruleorubidus]|uniref:Alanine-rich protein n=1 Tax=Streptomyces coeruleorubidus TaxID=116188 RepID=A0A5J6HWJ8_STRC4|nr:hypothetical protein [Streptomyces coeruleorubidus]QEV24599.1 hypothetical protein CP976_10830 [Streptomyces coeruleorubidus]GGT78397.1 hypothetical protein GCM10010256_41770 [Streptomyces coeruleorubidus]
MKASAFVYPWDVNGDPEAPARIAALGVEQVTLAAAYHSTRALTPRHPRHRIVTAEHAAVLYPAGDRWDGRELRPYAAGDWAPGDAFGEAAGALADAGLEVHTWVVLAHNSRLGAEHPDTSVVNAYGDRYPWAPCIAQPATRAYLTDLAAEAAVRPGARGTELESLGWYGLQHLHAHDKTGGVGLGDAGQYLMALCFCPACREGYGRHGLDAGELAAAVRTALEPVWQGVTPSDGGWTGVEKLLGETLANTTRAYRDATARTLQEEAVAAVRAAAPDGFQVLLHADPVSYHVGANPGVDPAHILSVADGVVVPCAGGTGTLTPFARQGKAGAVIAANFTVVSGMGGSPGTLAANAAEARRLGATELRLYHAGLASDSDLATVAEALRTRAG